MSAKTLARLAMLLGVLVLLWGAAALGRRRADAPAAPDRFRLPAPAMSAVDTVRIVKPTDTIVLARRDSSWTVNGHAGSRTAVNDFFTALADTSTHPDLVAERPASHAALGVDSTGGTRVRLLRGDSVIGAFIAGHRSTDLEGGYFRLEGHPQAYMLQGSLAGLLERSADDWRDRRIAQVAVDSIAVIEVQRGARGYKLSKSGKGWALAPSGPVDTAAVSRLRQAYGEIDASGFASSAQADSARFDRPERRVTLLRGDGSPLLRLTFDSTAQGFWVRADSSTTIYRMENWAVDRLAPADSTLKPSTKR
ncbi:MAG TPA: DUF4340 domain-containing protein [Gemmatimonadales bacterium]|nr:DUF4340 domain-containing protein [Gemmatimonadales bacterium]